MIESAKLHMASLMLITASLTMIGCGSGIARNIALTDKVVFIGDSITSHWTEYPGFQDHSNWIDRGISGQTSRQIAERFVADVLTLRPKTVNIVAGTNDVYPGWRPCSATASAAKPRVASYSVTNDTCHNMASMIEAAKQAGIKVVIGTIPPWGCSDDPHCGQSIADESASRYDRIAELNDSLHVLAKTENVTIIDYHSILSDPTGRYYAEGLTLDGVHPSMLAYTLMTPAVASAVE